MLGPILLHAALGVAVAVVVWAVGLGLLPRHPPVAYAVGLLAVTVASAAVLLSPWLALLVVPGLAVAAARARFGSALVPFAWSLPAALGLGTALGFLLHGPSASRDSNAYGDFVYYAEKVVAARASLVPLRDYLVEGQRSTYIEGAPTFIGAALSHLPGFDPFLFGAASLPAFLLSSLALGLGLMRLRGGWSLALLAVACVAYPTWLTESAPVALAVPLVFPLYALWRDGATRREWIVYTLVLGVDFVLTKGFGLITLAFVVAFALVRQYGLRLRTAVRWLLAGALIAGAAGALFLLTSSWLVHVLQGKFLPADAVRGARRQLTVRNTQALTPGLLVVGESLLLVGLLRLRAWAFAGILAAAMAGTWFVGGHGLDVTIGLAVLLAVLYLADRAVRPKALVLAAGALLALSAWFRDISGAHTAFFFVVLLGLGLYAALSRRAAVAAGAAVVALVAPFSLHRGQTTLPREEYAVWHRVAEAVPPDGLVFTSETGPVITGDQGWNYYPGVVRRQVYLAGWSNSSLLVRRRELRRRLDVNRRVLEGSLDPRTLRLSRHYSEFYAVVRRDEHGPGRRVYANDRFALYLIDS